MTMTLASKNGKVTGQIVIEYGGNTVRNRVGGLFDEATRTLKLEDVEKTPDSGRYLASFAPGSTSITGKFERSDGMKTVSFIAKRR